MTPIIDAHQHLWDLTRFSLPWLDDVESLRHDHLPSDYRRAVKNANVVKTVYMEVDLAPAQRLAEAEYVIDLCQRDDNPMAGAVIAADPADPDFAAYLDRFRDVPSIKGVRRVLHGPETEAGHCLRAPFVAGVRRLGELGLSFDICIRPAELADAVDLVDRCPGTRFILDHCGNPDPVIVNGGPAPDPGGPFAHDAAQWRRDIAALGARDNVVCKISGIVARAPEGWTAETLAPTVDHCLDSFAPDRVVFGGDWPVCTLAASFESWATALREIIAERGADAQRKLLHDNAARLYELE